MDQTTPNPEPIPGTVVTDAKSKCPSCHEPLQLIAIGTSIVGCASCKKPWTIEALQQELGIKVRRSTAPSSQTVHALNAGE